jgi:hypothetical protein
MIYSYEMYNVFLMSEVAISLCITAQAVLRWCNSFIHARPHIVGSCAIKIIGLMDGIGLGTDNEKYYSILK